jgi:hypothetical protein
MSTSKTESRTSQNLSSAVNTLAPGFPKKQRSTAGWVATQDLSAGLLVFAPSSIQTLQARVLLAARPSMEHKNETILPAPGAPKWWRYVELWIRLDGSP